MDNDLKQKWKNKGFLKENYPDEYVDTLIERYEEIEKWETKARKKAGPFNEQFCADVYAIASIMTKDGSFKGKFKPEELYEELNVTKEKIKGKRTSFSIFDETKVLWAVMDAHKKKTTMKKTSPKK